MMEHTVVLKALVGSRNYNLNTPESDRDYKYFVLPTFDDLYHRKMYSDAKIGDDSDYDVHDIRKLTHLWWKANVNFLEVLFSTDVDGDKIRWPELEEIYSRREEIARMNLPYLYDACRGMYYNKMKYIHKGTSGTQHLVDKFGYDTKQALHAFRILDFLVRYERSDFTDFKKAIWYERTDKQLVLAIKQGAFNFGDYERMAETKMEEAISIRERYKERDPNEGLKVWFEDKIYSMIKREIMNECAI